MIAMIFRKRTRRRAPWMILVLTAAFATKGFCDDAPLSVFGGTPKMMSEGDVAISMDTETVVIEPRLEDYRVAVVFEFFNHGASTNIAVGFPSVYPYGLGAGSDEIEDFATWVDGVRQAVGKLPGGKHRPVDPDDLKEEKQWLVAPMNFKGHARTEVWVSYTGEYNPQNLAPTEEMTYLFGTGRAWQGPIASALFVVKRSSSQPVMDAEFVGVPEGSAKAARFGELTYGFELKDVEPQPEARLTLTAAADWPEDWIAWPAGRIPAGKPAPARGAKLPPSLSLKFYDRAIGEDVLASLSLPELRLLRNAFFAAHGRPFTDPGLRDAFGRFAWYHPRQDFAESDLNAIETQNVRTIEAYEEKVRQGMRSLGSDLSSRVDPKVIEMLLGPDTEAVRRAARLAERRAARAARRRR